MRRGTGTILGGAGAAFAAFILLVGPIGWSSSADDEPSASPTTSASPSASPSDTPTDEETTEPESCDSRQAVVDFLGEAGFRRGEYTFKVRWKDLPDSNTSGRFSQPLTSIGDIATLRDTESRKAAALRQLLGSGVTTTDYVAVQLLGPFQYSGNWYWNGSEAVEGGTIYGLGGDVWWLHVSPGDCTVDPKVSLRAVCGNVGFGELVPWRVRED